MIQFHFTEDIALNPIMVLEAYVEFENSEGVNKVQVFRINARLEKKVNLNVQNVTQIQVEMIAQLLKYFGITIAGKVATIVEKDEQGVNKTFPFPFEKWRLLDPQKLEKIKKEKPKIELVQ